MCSSLFSSQNHFRCRKPSKECADAKETQALASAQWNVSLVFRVVFPQSTMHITHGRIQILWTAGEFYFVDKERHNKSLCSKWQQAVDWKLFLRNLCLLRAQSASLSTSAFFSSNFIITYLDTVIPSNPIYSTYSMKSPVIIIIIIGPFMEANTIFEVE